MSFNLGSAHGEIVIDYNGAGVKQAMGDLNSLQQTGTNLIRAGAGISSFGGAIGGALLGATNQAADFQFQMDAVNAALGGLDASQMEVVTQQALDMGAASKFSAGEVAGVQEQLAKSGLSVEQITGGATQAVLDMAAATGESLVPAASAAAAALNLFGLDATQTADVADIFTAGLNASSATLADFQRGVNNLGPVMANLNQYANDGEGAFRDTAAAVAYFNAQGLKAADAGVSLARGLTDLATPTSKAAQTMIDLGISAFDAQGNFIGFPALMDELNVALAGASDATREKALADIFGAEAVDVMNQAVKKGGDGLRQYQQDIEANGQAAEQAKIRQDNLRGALEQLTGSISTAAINIGSTFLGPLQAIVEGITTLVNAFNSLPPEVQATIAQFAALVAAMALLSGGALTAAGVILRFGPVFAAAAAAAGPFLAILAAITAAIAIGIVAYKTDFLGFGTAVDRGLKRASTAVQRFGNALDTTFAADKAKGLNDVAAGVDALGVALFAATGIDLTDKFRTLSDGVQEFGNSMATAAAQGAGPFQSLFYALGNAFDAMGLPEIADQFDKLQQASANFGTNFEAVRASAQEAGFSDIAADIKAFGDSLEYVTGLPVSDFFSGVADAVQVFGTSFETARADGLDPFSSGLVALRDTLTQLTGIDLAPRFDALGDALGSARDGAAEFFDTLRSGDIAGALQQLSDAAAQGIQSLVDTVTAGLQSIDLGQIAVNITGWVKGKWDDLKTWIEDQTGLDLDGITIAQAVVNITSWVAGKIADLGEAIQSFLGFGGGTAQAGLGGTGVEEVDLGAVAVSVSDWIAGTLASADALAAEIADWLRGQLEVSPEFVTMAGELGADIGQKIGTALANAIAQGISDVMSGGGGAGGGPGLNSLDTALASGAGFGAGGGFSLGDAFANFDTQFTQAVEAALGPEFEQIKSELTTWIEEKKNDLWSAITDLMNSLSGGSGIEAGLASGAGFGATMVQSASDTVLRMFQDFADSFIEAIQSGIDSAVESIKAAIEEKQTSFKNGIMDALRGIFDFVTGTQEAQAAPGEGLDAAQLGTDMGGQFAEVFKSPEFTDSFETALDSIDPAAFSGIASGLLTKINAAIGTAMQTQGPGAASETGQGTSPIGGDMGASLVSSITTGLQQSIDSAKPETFAAIGTSLVAKIQGAISAAMTTTSTEGQQGPVGEGAVGGMGASLVSGLATSIATSITAAPIEAFAAIGTALQTKISEVLATAMQVGGGQATPQAGLGGTGGGGGIGQAIAQSIADAISGADFAAVATALQTNLGTAVTTAIQQISTTISTATNVWITTFITTFTAIAQAALAGMAGVVTSVQAGLQAISERISSYTNVWITTIITTVAAMQASLTGFATSAAASGQAAGQGFSDGLSQGMSTAQSTVVGVVAAIVGIMNAAADQAYTAGQAVGQGFADGIASMAGAVEDAAGALAGAAAGAIAAVAKLGSPSKVTTEMGQWFGEGFALGIAGAAPNAAKSSYDMGFESIHALADSLRSNAETTRSRVRSLGDHIRENQGLASGGGQPMTIETTGTVEMDGQAMGTFVVETSMGGLAGAMRKGGKRRGRMQ